MEKNEIISVQNINESQVPTLIQDQFGQLKVLKQNVELATKKAESAQESAKTAKSKSAGMFHKKEAIEALQDAAIDLADAQISQAEAQELSFEYQQKLGEITKYLFGLGVTNIAVNRSVVRELEMRLRGASEEELDELARQEIIGVVKQLKAQEDIMKKQSELTDRVKQHESKLVWQEEKQIELERIFKEKAEHEKKQDEELSGLVNELIQSNLDKEAQIRELKSKCEDLTNQIASGSEYGSIKNKLDEMASKKGLIVSYIIGAAALIASIVQFFV